MSDITGKVQIVFISIYAVQAWCFYNIKHTQLQNVTICKLLHNSLQNICCPVIAVISPVHPLCLSTISQSTGPCSITFLEATFTAKLINVQALQPSTHNTYQAMGCTFNNINHHYHSGKRLERSSDVSCRAFWTWRCTQVGVSLMQLFFPPLCLLLSVIAWLNPLPSFQLIYIFSASPFATGNSKAISCVEAGARWHSMQCRVEVERQNGN